MAPALVSGHAEGCKLKPLIGLNPEQSPDERFRAIWDGYEGRPQLVQRNLAGYAPSRDLICMPSRIAFESNAAYAATFLHEVGHSTGHPSRLNRPTLTMADAAYGETYGREELVAEMTSAFLLGAAGIQHQVASTAAYIASWRKVISDDPKAVVWAAHQAQLAADWVLGKREAK